MPTTEELYAQVPGPFAPGADPQAAAPSAANAAALAAANAAAKAAPNAALAELEQLKTDPAHADFRKQVGAGNPEALAKWREAHQKAFGANAQSADGIARQMSARDAAFDAARDEQWRNAVNPETPQEALEFERGNATTSEKAAARRNIERMIADKQFGRKIVDGDYDALQRWNRMNWVAHRAREIPDAN